MWLHVALHQDVVTKVLFIHKSVSPITVLAQLQFRAAQEDCFPLCMLAGEQGSLVLCKLLYLITFTY